MTKSATSSATAPRLCPTCGTRVGAVATKCLVCGADLTVKAGAGAAGKPRTAALGANAPRLRIPIPLIVILVLLLAVGGIVAYMFYSGKVAVPQVAATATTTATITLTSPPTFTLTPTQTETPVPTDTPLPPEEYKVASGDTCVAIAAAHNVSSQSIIALNHLDPNCNLSVGRTLLIPQPTPTPTALPTATLGAAVATQVERTTYTVHAGDTLLGIAKFNGLTLQDLMDANGISDPANITAGQILIIPLEKVVTAGPSPTPTPPPPWPAPNLLVPADGESFNAGQVVSLQWTSVGTLRTDEFYFVSVEDVTCNCARVTEQAVTETKWIVPADFRHTDNTIHVYRWTVTTVHQKSTDSGGKAEYESAGATSPFRDFIWMGGSGTATP